MLKAYACGTDESPGEQSSKDVSFQDISQEWADSRSDGKWFRATVTSKRKTEANKRVPEGIEGAWGSAADIIFPNGWWIAFWYGVCQGA